MSHTPTRDLVDHLSTNLAALTSGTNLFDSQVRAPHTGGVPEDAVFVWGTGGPLPERTMGEPDEVCRTVIHFRVRHQKAATGLTWARDILEEIQGVAIATYLDVYRLIAEPRALGQDSDGRNYFGGEVMMVYISD